VDLTVEASCRLPPGRVLDRGAMLNRVEPRGRFLMDRTDQSSRLHYLRTPPTSPQSSTVHSTGSCSRSSQRMPPNQTHVLLAQGRLGANEPHCFNTCNMAMQVVFPGLIRMLIAAELAAVGECSKYLVKKGGDMGMCRDHAPHAAKCSC
jgi:hypothetical protein